MLHRPVEVAAENQPSKVCFLYLDHGLLLTRNKALQKGTAPIIKIPVRIPLTPSAGIH